MTLEGLEPVEFMGFGADGQVAYRHLSLTWAVVFPIAQISVSVRVGNGRGHSDSPLSRGGAASNMAGFTVCRPSTRMIYYCDGPLTTSCYPDDSGVRGPYGSVADVPLAGRYR